MPKPSVGQPSFPIASPSESRIVVVSSSATLPVASATPSTPRTTSSSDASIGGSRWLLAVDRDVEAAAGDDRVRPRVRVGEQVRERALDRVREDVRAADHRDAEDDRDAGQDRAELAPGEAAKRDLDHRSTIVDR